jgi:hypothetical protein
MRGIFLVLAIGFILLGCTQAPPEPVPNVTNNTTAPPECEGPVCGSDGNTYTTDCEAEIADVSVLYVGECQINCTETDNGVDIEIAGSATRGEVVAHDECIDGSQLLEYTCLDNQIDSVTVQCGPGKECKDSKCVALPPPPVNTTPPVNPGCVGPGTYDIHVKGSVVLNGTEYSDTCIEFMVVKDYYCKDDKMEAVNNECPAGYGCTLGACVVQEFVCTETDGGKDLLVKGNTIVSKGIHTSFNKIDECIEVGTIEENYCLENGTAATEELDCGTGFKCVNGKCIESDCSETDGGKDIYNFGTATDVADEEFEDECIDDHKIREYYCFGDDVRDDDIPCGAGYICNSSEDECVEGSVDD